MNLRFSKQMMEQIRGGLTLGTLPGPRTVWTANTSSWRIGPLFFLSGSFVYNDVGNDNDVEPQWSWGPCKTEVQRIGFDVEIPCIQNQTCWTVSLLPLPWFRRCLQAMLKRLLSVSGSPVSQVRVVETGFLYLLFKKDKLLKIVINKIKTIKTHDVLSTLV